MVIETIAVKTATSILSKLTTWGLKELFKSDLTNYEKELSKIIQDSIEEYKDLYPIEETDKIPFYTSLVLTDEFFKFRFTSKLDEDIVLKAIREDERIILPSKDQLLKFFEIFNKKIEVSDKLRELNIESNYKEEIFKISNVLREVKELLLSSFNELKIQLNSLAITTSLTEEWSKQLDEILDNLKRFKPFTAQERLKNLEKRMIDAGLETYKKIFARLYYLQAKCLEQMEGMDQLDDEASLLVKAYRFNKENEEFKGYAALGYFFLGDEETASELGEELLLEDRFNITGWIIKCFLKGDNFKDALETVPKIVKADRFFKIQLFHWLFHNKYIQKIKEFEDLDLGFEINIAEKPTINYLNRHYSLLKAQYLLSKYYERQKLFNSSLYLPDAKEDNEFVYANRILEEVLQAIKGSEIEKNHNYYAFQYYCSSVILDEDTKHVFKMEEVFNQLEFKSIDTVIRMAQAYNNLNEDNATKKAIKILEEITAESNEQTNEVILIFKLINCSIIKDQIKVEEYFTKYIDFYSSINRNSVLNIISFLRKGQMVFTQPMLEKLQESIRSKSFVSDFLRQVIQIAVYVSFGLGFDSDENFYQFLKTTEANTDSGDKELFIHVAFGFAQIGKWNEALNFLKGKFNFDEASEPYKLYCKILYKVDGHKPELFEHLEKWRKNFQVDYELLEMELYFSELQKNWKKVVEIAKVGVKVFPRSEKFICYLFVGMYEKIDIQGIRDYSKLAEGIDFKEENYGLNITMTLLKAGLKEQALELIYKQASNIRNIKTRQSYVTLSMQCIPPSKYLLS